MAPRDPEMLAAMEHAVAAIGDMTGFSQRVFARFLADYPDEAARFINLDAAVLRMTDETLVLLLGLAGGEGWAPGGAAHWADLHRNYGAIADDRYRAWTRLVVEELASTAGADWVRSAQGWAEASEQLTALLLTANQGTSQPASH